MQNQDIVVIIDCWAGYMGPTDLRTEMCHNICESIFEIRPKLAVLATYQSNEIFDQHLKKNNVWIANFWKYFPEFDGAKVGGPPNLTHDIILNSEFDCEQIALTRFWQLEYVLDHLITNLNRAWYFGLHWNQCIMDRELGWHNLKNYYRKNKKHDVDIMFKDNCTLKIPFEKDATIEIWPLMEQDQITVTEPLGDNVWKLR